MGYLFDDELDDPSEIEDALELKQLMEQYNHVMRKNDLIRAEAVKKLEKIVKDDDYSAYFSFLGEYSPTALLMMLKGII